ncbi:MAG: hypothetical protein AB1500_00915 [Bacillota bacterium]
MAGSDSKCGGETTNNLFALQRFERNAYFYGKLMTVRDFQLEQSYFNQKRFLNGRLIHGQGIVCGLEVKGTGFGTGSASEKLVVSVTPGAALDGCGREIVVDRIVNEEEVDIPGIESLTGTKKFYLFLKYKESLGEPVPALANASNCEEVCCNSRIKEGFEFILSDQEPPAEEPVNPEKSDPCPLGEDEGVLLAALDINKETKTAAVNAAETKKHRGYVYNNPLLYSLLSEHKSDHSNPHDVKHAQTGPAGWDQTESAGDANKRSKHLSTEDAGKWNNAAQAITAHKGDFNNPHQVKHGQTGPVGWDQVDASDPNDKKSRKKHVSTEDAEKWNKAAENPPEPIKHYKIKISEVAQGQRKEQDIEIKLNYNEPVVLGVEVVFNKKIFDKFIEGIKEKYKPDEEALKKWLEQITAVIKENKIEEINEYYTGDLSLMSLWALVIGVGTAPVVVRQPTEGLLGVGLKQIPAPALAARIDRVGKKLSIILQDRRVAEARLKEFVDYTVVFWIGAAKTVKEL